ncbi:glycosyltransferase family 4 protein [Paenibacillus gallinarum]|uniref:Glycosyltransferase family 4 protein n=1 Tax=Paenibacillus gallinarum TaxID=2762232 RepID=A0ABR8T4W1_9BACL|nr:glycosyltransferase family 4 protein [Paenibacillus gallinarum]MBD7970811.1 glycosyltransferase family 4 protein [Paenibacillus gallinarum]
MMKPTVVVVGSSLKDMGGIVTVIRNIEQSTISNFFQLLRVETYITGNAYVKIKIFLNALFKYLKILMTKHPDIIHIHMSERGSFYRKAIFLLIGKMFRIPVIFHLHGADFNEFYNSNKLQKKICEYILNKANKLIVLSVEWKNYYSNIVPVDKVEVLYNGVFTNKNMIPDEKDNDYPMCLFLGRLGKRKGTYDLIEAILMLKSKGIKAKFIFAGDGEIEEVKRVISEKELLDYIDVLGWIDTDQREKLLKLVDILVLPSYNEGLPMAVLEAMSNSLPIVATFVGGIPEVILNGKNGFLIDPGDIDGLTESLETLINDKKLRQAMGMENRIIISEKFDMNIITKKLRTIYQSIIC